MKYVDGFVLPVPKKNVRSYRSMAAKAGKIWMELGALEYREAVGDDMRSMAVTFPKMARAKSSETVFFSWIVYSSRKQRDAVNAKVMKDPRILAMMKGKKMPFDFKRMCYGGFDVLVDQTKTKRPSKRRR